MLIAGSQAVKHLGTYLFFHSDIFSSHIYRVCHQGPFQYPIRRLIVRSREVSKPRDLYLELSDSWNLTNTSAALLCDNLNCHLSGSILHEILRWFLSDIETGLSGTKYLTNLLILSCLWLLTWIPGQPLRTSVLPAHTRMSRWPPHTLVSSSRAWIRGAPSHTLVLSSRTWITRATLSYFDVIITYLDTRATLSYFDVIITYLDTRATLSYFDVIITYLDTRATLSYFDVIITYLDTRATLSYSGVVITYLDTPPHTLLSAPRASIHT